MKNLFRTVVVTLVFWIFLAVMISPPISMADEVINDDLIVNGSECIGFDCVTDQPFSYSTLILKEQNLRIFFDDTSSSANFPNTDWEIIVNDSVNGGQSFLGFADRGAGVTSASGQGYCVGSPRDGEICGTGIQGEDCSGVCVGTTLGYDPPCSGPDDYFCNIQGGTCENYGECVAPGAVIFRIEAGGPEDSLVIDSAGDVKIAGNLTVEGTINGNGGNSSEIEELQEEIDALKAQMETLLSIPFIKRYLETK